MARKYLRGRTWWCGVYVDGVEDRFSLKTRSEKVAERILSKIETEVAEGRWLDRKVESRWTLGQLAELYLERLGSLRPRSSAWRRDRFARVLEAVGRETPIEEIGPEVLDRVSAAWLKRGLAIATVRSNVSVLRHALRMAYRWRSETGLSEYRLPEWTAPGGRPPRPPRFLSREEVGRLLAAAGARALAFPEHRRAAVLMRVALATGARVGELCRLRAADFDGARGWIRLAASKGGLERSTDLSGDPKLVRELRALFRADQEPFAGGGAAKDRFRRFWRAVRVDARLPDLRFHDLRHTFASEYLRRGATPRALQDQLGHRTGRMTERYSHSSKRKAPPAGIAWRRYGQKAHSRGRRRA